MDLEEQRKKIDAIDDQLIALLEQRMRTAEEIARIKQAEGLAVTDPLRERRLLDRIMERSSADLAGYNRILWNSILEMSKDHQRKTQQEEAPVVKEIRKALTETPPPNYTGVAPITFAVANGVIYMPGDTLPAGVTLPDDASLPGDVIWENNNNKTFSLKIPNVHIQPPENEIRVEKRWVDQNGNTAEGSRDVKVQLRRKKLDSHNVTVVFEAGQYSGNTPHFEEVFSSVSGDTVTIEYSLLPNNGQWNRGCWYGVFAHPAQSQEAVSAL